MNNSTRFKLLFAFAIASSFSFGQEKKEIEKKARQYKPESQRWSKNLKLKKNKLKLKK